MKVLKESNTVTQCFAKHFDTLRAITVLFSNPVRMLTLVTSCGRLDLLARTVGSFMMNQHQPVKIVVHEDDPKVERGDCLIGGDWIMTELTGGVGQHKSIEKVLQFFSTAKYYVHLEDDWEFHNTYDWIAESIAIMEANPDIIKVLCRDGSPHPCEHKWENRRGMKYGILDPWTGPDGINWKGFSWNPGVTRLDLLKKFIPLPKTEQEVGDLIHEAGYRVAELSIPIYKHIGDGRSTHD